MTAFIFYFSLTKSEKASYNRNESFVDIGAFFWLLFAYERFSCCIKDDN